MATACLKCGHHPVDFCCDDVPIEEMTATEARRRFSDVFDRAYYGRPFRITKGSRSVLITRAAERGK